jgi:ABC-type protease/lipase transport system fused ATPase/permease subunit
MLAARALGPIDQIVAHWRTMSQAISSYGAIRTQLSAQDVASKTALPAPAPRLQVNQATVLTPARDRMMMSGVSFAAEGGQIVGVIGVSGAGKTTLMQVLANARTPDQGDVRIDGARYTDWDSEKLGRFLGYVPQDCALFPGTVKDNISRFDISAGVDPARVDEMAVAAAKEAGVHELILSLPGGYDATLGPRGRGLSAGQQQRIALARAMYGEPIIYIFDEPNSNLDSEGEAILVDVITRLRARGALIIVAAHRLSLIASADLLAVMREGRLERFGPRNDVLESLKQQQAPPPAQQQPQKPAPRPSAAPVGVLGGAR